MSKAYQIAVLTQKEFIAWDEYVMSHDDGTFFHLSGWQTVIENSFSHPCYFLFAKQNDKICGVLPLVEIKSALFGHALVSTPFCVYGGVIADDQEIQTALEKEAVTIAEKLNVDHLELRYRTEQQNEFILKQAHCTFGCEIAQDAESILAKVKKKQRAVIRHSLKNELSHSVTKNISDFYHLLSQSYRNLGTPIFKKAYFQNLINVFGDNVDITLIKDQSGQPSNAVMNFYFKESVLPYYGGGNADARFIKSADYMYYQVLCHARERGCHWYDFGRSKNDSGPFKYKKNWGMEPKPLYYYYHLVKAKELPNLSPNNPKYKMFINMWQKLPLKVSQFLGPFLSKYLG
ncbi:FemAB family XrtA/PEP-CTERM system-associated protein [Colwelliaceae bacterium 6441]